MATRIYIRRIDKQCVTHQISITAEVHTKVFLDQPEMDVVGKYSGTVGKISVLPATDRRLGGAIKNIIKSELDDRPLTEGDILIIRNVNRDQYELQVVIPGDSAYGVFDSLCGKDKHAVVIASEDAPQDEIDVHQLIRFGVPGTGKSKGITDKIRETYEDYEETGACEFVFRTTLHPEYSYYDFVGATCPVVNKDKSITYDFNPGIFTQALTKALDPRTQNQKVFLVLEEMSRANVAAVFGDLFQLLDRDVHGVSEYKIRNDLIAREILKKTGRQMPDNCIFLPSNLYIYGTVNTSDQNVFVMDNAFKRRFEFEYVGTEPVCADGETYLNDYAFTIGSLRCKWTDFYQVFNAYVTRVMGLREDKQIGPFFLKFRQGSASQVVDTYNYNQIKNKLLQYLWEDVHKCAMAQRPLFREGIDSFGDAYSRLARHENVFCDEFCDMLREAIDRGTDDTQEESGEILTDEGNTVSDNQYS